MTTQSEQCPLCGCESSDVSWQTANSQEVCGNSECPVNTWDPDKSVSEAE